MPHLPNLELMYHDMQHRGDIASSFNVTHNRHGFRCIFIADEIEKTLFLSSTGENAFTITFNISDTFEFNSRLNNTDYTKLVRYLNIKYDPINKFSPATFIAELDTHFPDHVVERPTPRERARTVSRAKNVPDGEVYFKGWIKWTKKGVRPENVDKTKSIVGGYQAERIRKANISSCWSPNPEDEDLAKLDAWIAMVDQ